MPIALGNTTSASAALTFRDWLPTITAVVIVLPNVIVAWASYRLFVRQERLKRRLDAAAFESQTRFFSLHEARARIIEEAYTKLRQAKVAYAEMVFTARDTAKDGQLIASFIRHFDDFWTYFQEHRIYFDQSLCEEVDDYVATVRVAHISHSMNQSEGLSLDGSTPPDVRSTIVAQKVAFRDERKKAEEQQEDILRKIETAFRAVLGVSDEPRQPTKARKRAWFWRRRRMAVRQQSPTGQVDEERMYLAVGGK